MNNVIEITRLSVRSTTAKNASKIMEADNIPYRTLDCVNWEEEFPYKPEVKFRIAHTGSSIILNYKVRELSVRAVEDRDNSNVWEDSCVEFFLQKPEEKEYYNIECNCIGKILIACGANRSERHFLSNDMLDTVDRYTSLGNDTFEEKSAPEEWEVSLIIPSRLFGIKTLRNMHLKANFYKCGDMLSEPHYLSWMPINTPSPDFHQPSFFGKLIFKS